MPRDAARARAREDPRSSRRAPPRRPRRTSFSCPSVAAVAPVVIRRTPSSPNPHSSTNSMMRGSSGRANGSSWATATPDRSSPSPHGWSFEPHRLGDQPGHVGQAEHVLGIGELMGGDERHADQAVVEGERVPDEAALAEVLTVVRRDDRRWCRRARRPCPWRRAPAPASRPSAAPTAAYRWRMRSSAPSGMSRPPAHARRMPTKVR